MKVPNDGARLAKLRELNILALNNFQNAELIFGLDEETGNRFVVFGGELLQEITEGPSEGRECSVMVIRVLQRTMELEALLAAVQVARSYYDYADGTQSVADVLQRRRDDFNRLVQGA